VLGISAVSADPVTTTPPGWYPDPGGLAQWRRWEGTTWSTATLPYGPAPPDEWLLAQDRLAARFLHSVAPWGLVAPAFGAAAYASWSSSSFGPLRIWFHAATAAIQRSQPLPTMPQSHMPTAVTLTFWAVWLVSIIGVGAWLRYTLAATRVVAAAGYPARRHAAWTCLGFFIPFVGPLIAGTASREWLPVGHEARPVLTVGWTLVAIGEVAVAALWITAIVSSSVAAAWALAGACALAWVGAALELPRGFEAIADDHVSLGVRRAARPS